MREACSLIWSALVLLFRSRASLAAEILVLRHQINILRRHSPKRQTFSAMDRLIFAGLYRLAPTVLNALAVLKPDTVIKWHRAGFRSYWRWRSRRRGGRPTVPPEIRKLIREMSIANPLWGAPRIHGELLKLGIEIGQTSVAKYMARRRGPPSQGWQTFLHNHADGIAAMDLFVVPTISFRLLYGLLIVGYGRRQILWFGVTAHPTAEWIANQITERPKTCTDSDFRCLFGGDFGGATEAVRGSRGSDPRLLGLTMGWLLDRTLGSDPVHQGSSRP